MFFEDEPQHIKNARQAPLVSSYDSRHPPERYVPPAPANPVVNSAIS